MGGENDTVAEYLNSTLSLRARRVWQSSRGRYVGCRDDAGGCPMVPLECRVAALLTMAGRQAGTRETKCRKLNGYLLPMAAATRLGFVAQFPTQVIVTLP
jgi:hypothetical protein